MSNGVVVVDLQELLRSMLALKACIDRQQGPLICPLTERPLSESVAYRNLAQSLEKLHAQYLECGAGPVQVVGIKAAIVRCEEAAQGPFDLVDFRAQVTAALRQCGAYLLGQVPCTSVSDSIPTKP